MKTFIKRVDLIGFRETGYANGYVCIPKGHRLHSVHYDDINVQVHGGLTFSCNASELDWKELPKRAEGTWVVGFDTCHYSDNKENCDKEYVLSQVESLKNQLINY